MRYRSFAFVALLGCLVSAGGWAQEKTYSRSLEIGAMTSYSYSDSFSKAGFSYGAVLNYGYIFSEHYLLGITLVRYQDYLQAPVRQMNFSYGFYFRHSLAREILDLRPLTPWVSYAILLNQAFQVGVDGREIGHNTHIGVGCDWTLTSENRVYFELGWDTVSFPSFATKSALELSTVNASLGYRWLF